ncbi:MAG: hypothetical protein KAQ67_06355 [Gammaproteobacteria bacterium]|nr:hypothetical protein [Gammaproteobacteria bacterium]
MKRLFLPQIILFFLILNNAVLANELAQADLLKKYHAIKNNQVVLLQNNLIHIQSDVTDERLSADVYAVKSYAFDNLVKKLSRSENWCQFVTLHLNIKACVYQRQTDTFLSFYAGRKFYEPAENAFELKYLFKIKEKKDNYFKLSLSAESGPFSTSDYLIEVELVKFDNDTLIHFSLAYNSSFSSRLGARAYLATIGSDKKGFSQTINAEGKKEYIKGVEGIIERNVMRYFLALNAYLDTVNGADNMMSVWFDETEKYYDQLHELDKADYIRDKKLEFQQQAVMQERVNLHKSIFKEDESD